MLLRYIGTGQRTSVENGYGDSLTLEEDDLFFVHPENDLHEKYPALFEVVTNRSTTVATDLQAIADADLPGYVDDAITAADIPGEVTTEVASAITAEDIPGQITDALDPLLQKVIVPIATGAVLTLNGTPVELVAAPAANKAIEFVSALLSINYNSIAYTTNTTIELRYENGSGAKVSADVAALLDATADKNINVKAIVTELVVPESKALVAYVPSGNPAAGNSNIEVTVFYRVIDVLA